MSEKNIERIERIRVPDDDVPGWLKTLQDGGFTEEEIQGIMSHLNKAYAESSEQTLAMIEAEVREIVDYIRTKYGRILDPDQVEHLRRGVRERLGIDEDSDDS